MTHYFTYLWTREEIESWKPELGKVEGSYSNTFKARGVKRGDVIYLWGYFDATLFLINRFTVQQIKRVAKGSNFLRKSEFAVAQIESDIQLDVAISESDVGKLQFMPDNKPPRYRKPPFNNQPEPQTFRGVREITADTAALLDSYLTEQRDAMRTESIELKACDLQFPPERIETIIQRVVRDTAITKKLKERYKHECQVCHESIYIDIRHCYSEVHHLRPLGKNHQGLDVEANMIVLCPNHHAMFDFGIPVFRSTTVLDINDRKIDIVDKHGISKKNIDYYMNYICINKNK